MYKLTRINTTTNDISENSINPSFLLKDSEFKFLKEMGDECNPEKLELNQIYLNKHPSIIYDNISNSDFVQDYQTHLLTKKYVLYKYKKVDEENNK